MVMVYFEELISAEILLRSKGTKTWTLNRNLPKTAKKLCKLLRHYWDVIELQDGQIMSCGLYAIEPNDRHLRIFAIWKRYVSILRFFTIFSTCGSMLRIFRGAECEPWARKAGPEASFHNVRFFNIILSRPIGENSVILKISPFG